MAVRELPPDPLKDSVRHVFNKPSQARRLGEKRLAEKFLFDRVPFAADLPPDQLNLLATTLELRGLIKPGRPIFQRGRKAWGDAYIMFTGSADQIGHNHASDRLIKEGDFFGESPLSVELGDCEDIRTATVVARTAPCEILVLPPRVHETLQGVVTKRTRKKAFHVYRTCFHNMPEITCLELAGLSAFRKLNVDQYVACRGQSVQNLFFVVRGEYLQAAGREGKQMIGGGQLDSCRFGPGHVIGW
ncbi:unnamed protein product [Discosporangium mesarthrocarpum]